MNAAQDPQEGPWIARYDQKRGEVDEFLVGLIKTLQRASQPPTEAYLKLWCYLDGLPHDSLSAVAASAISRLAAKDPP